MIRLLFPIALLFLFESPRLMAGGPLPVIDAAQLAASRAQSRLNYIQQLLQETNQQTQIVHVIEQIRQSDAYLNRFGDPGKIFSLNGFDSLVSSLGSAAINQASDDLLATVSGAEMFAIDDLGIYEAVEAHIDVDAETVGSRDSALYKPEEAAERSFEQYREARTAALTNRAQLREALAEATQQLKAASTSSEVQKLTGILIGLQTELAANDREIDMATAEVMTRMLENENRREVARKAAVEDSREQLRQGHLKDERFYQLLSEPTYFTRD